MQVCPQVDGHSDIQAPAPTITRHDEQVFDVLPPPPRGNILDRFKSIMQSRAGKEKSIAMSAYSPYERSGGAQAVDGAELPTSTASNPFHSDKL